MTFVGRKRTNMFCSCLWTALEFHLYDLCNQAVCLDEEAHGRVHEMPLQSQQ